VKLPDGVDWMHTRAVLRSTGHLPDDSKTVADKNMWFDFDDLNFKNRSADITDESMKQVHNITAILKAYPKLKLNRRIYR